MFLYYITSSLLLLIMLNNNRFIIRIPQSNTFHGDIGSLVGENLLIASKMKVYTKRLNAFRVTVTSTGALYQYQDSYVLTRDSIVIHLDKDITISSYNSNESYMKTLNYSIQFVNSCNPGLIMNNMNYIRNNNTGIYSIDVYPSTSNEYYMKTPNYSIQFVNSCNPGLIMNNMNYISNNDTGIYSIDVYPSTSVNQVNHSTMIQLCLFCDTCSSYCSSITSNECIENHHHRIASSKNSTYNCQTNLKCT
ncbi:Spectrin beta chain [Schistosoma japonicum]|nr:Spectrin beta chain [Schistosoma japonicum]